MITVELLPNRKQNQQFFSYINTRFNWNDLSLFSGCLSDFWEKAVKFLSIWCQILIGKLIFYISSFVIK